MFAGEINTVGGSAGNGGWWGESLVMKPDPQADRVTETPENMPARSWKMYNDTKRWVTIVHSTEE